MLFYFQRKTHSYVWIGVTDILGKKYESKRLLSFARETNEPTPGKIVGKLGMCFPMCPPRELVIVNLTSASRNWLFTLPVFCSHLNS